MTPRPTDDSRRPVPEHVHLIRALASLALDYLRWTQLVPMLFAWTFLLLMVGALLLTNFQERSFSLIERGLTFYEQVLGPVEPPPVEPPTSDEPTDDDAGPGDVDPSDVDPDSLDPNGSDPNGSGPESTAEDADGTRTEPASTNEGTRFSDEDIMPVVLRAWALLALVGWLFGVLRSMLFGPRQPGRLWPKLRIALYCAAGCSGLMWIAYGLGGGTYHGSVLGWALLFTGLPLGVWLVSVWSLGFGHVIAIVQRHLHA